MYCYSCVAYGSQFRFKKIDKKMIHLQETTTCQRDRAVVTREQVVFFQARVNGTEFVPNIDTKLLLKISSVERSGLELQDHLANQSLLWCQGNGPQKRQAIFVKDAHILFEVVRVLEIHAAEMRKRGNSDPDHVAAMPKRVTINEPASLFLSGDDVGAGDFVAVCKKLFESVIEPIALRLPTSDRRGNALLQNVLRDDCVVR